MKILKLIIALLIFSSVKSQSTSDTKIEAKLFVPSHVSKGISADQKLVIHYVARDANGKLEKGKITGKKVS